MKEEINHDCEHSVIIPLFSRFIEWGNEHFTLSQWFFKNSKKIFAKLEAMVVLITLVSLWFLFVIRHMPYWFDIAISILLIQRVLEFFIVYSRNFIFGRGRIFSHFYNYQKRGEWLITMFALNVLQIVVIFAIWYQVISYINPMAFSQPLYMVNSLYFSFTTFMTVGYGDIYAIGPLARIVVIGQMALTFYTLVIVVNGLISLHFKKS